MSSEMTSSSWMCTVMQSTRSAAIAHMFKQGSVERARVPMSLAIFLTWIVPELVPLVFNSISGAPAEDSVLTGDGFKKIFVKVDSVWCYQTVTAVMSRTSIDGQVRRRLSRLRNAAHGL